MCRQFNARSETVPEKAIFKRLLGRQRCVVLLNGFYEWAKVWQDWIDWALLFARFKTPRFQAWQSR